MHDESLYAKRVLRAGGHGICDKTRAPKTVKSAIRKVLGSDMHLSDKMASVMVEKLMRGNSDKPASLLKALSDLELDVFRMLEQEKLVRLIFEEMSATIPTVDSFRNRIKEKLQLKTSTEVVLRPIRWVQDQTIRYSKRASRISIPNHCQPIAIESGAILRGIS